MKFLATKGALTFDEAVEFDAQRGAIIDTAFAARRALEMDSHLPECVDSNADIGAHIFARILAEGFEGVLIELDLPSLDGALEERRSFLIPGFGDVNGSRLERLADVQGQKCKPSDPSDWGIRGRSGHALTAHASQWTASENPVQACRRRLPGEFGLELPLLGGGW